MASAFISRSPVTLIDQRFAAFALLMGMDQGATDAGFDLGAQRRNPLTEFEGNAVALPAHD